MGLWQNLWVRQPVLGEGARLSARMRRGLILRQGDTP
jgi:hypothetical protein